MRQINKKINTAYSPLKVIGNQDACISFKKIDRLVIPTNEGYFLIPFDEILYLKADSNYTTVVSSSGQKTIVSKTLKSLHAQLNQLFIRVHQSYVVNITHIRKYDYTNGFSLTNSKLIPISRSKKQEIKHLFAEAVKA